MMTEETDGPGCAILAVVFVGFLAVLAALALGVAALVQVITRAAQP